MAAEEKYTDLLNECAKEHGIEDLKRQQIEAVTSLLDGQDVFAVLPTGFGKSLIYQLYVVAKSRLTVESDESNCKPSILVISPLNSIVEEQLKSNEFSLNVVALSLQEDALEKINQCEYDIVYTSAELALNSKFTSLLKDHSSPFRNNLHLIVVDESHTVCTWGTATKKGKKQVEAFRKDYGALSGLRSFCSGKCE
ncbi:hypothetical protein QZH41_016822 [Actinostola sp. cb2023]|nr:hypothetical protein QZH41_016824 [Actinostola sp. cb2023]KAK3728960.1 hypothetical protein QZH41_016822 [Actinostola sp. cb2023]